ncbi:zinc finger and BTB domain-containing protein 49-like [Anopheles coustani]|uniref:zinc finger and BTB domain-containing protein 49-like n=1 Tax=Anopheles coustani TaxID=139045 RepID=UPI002657EFFD|nr:zinc finger and BTB domain-containing protein 49-like [Anopheles coustani]
MTAKTIQLREKCRFCLCSDDLLSFSEALNTAFDFEDVRHFTGIEMAKDADIAVCYECCTSINESKNFRLTCLRNDSIFKRLMCLDDRSTTHNITIARAAPKDEVKSEHDVITLDDSESDDSSSHLGQPVSDDKNTLFHDENQSNYEHGKTYTYEQSRHGSDTDGHSGKLDGNDSDYSMPSLFDETTHKPSKDADMQQSLDAESMIGTKIEKSAECATDVRRENSKTDCTCISRNKESSTNWSRRKRIVLDPNDSDDSITSLYTECNRKRSGTRHLITTCPVHATSSDSALSLRRHHVLCHLCGAIVDRMKRHLDGAHGGEKTIACPFCPKKFAEPYHLKPHINTWHERKIILTCSICGKGFVNEGSYTYHMTNKHVKSDLYECTTCKRKLKSWDGYKKHLKEHSLTALKCEDCGRLYKNMVTLEKHKLRYHSS